jgi:hypothetical protein
VDEKPISIDVLNIRLYAVNVSITSFALELIFEFLGSFGVQIQHNSRQFFLSVSTLHTWKIYELLILTHVTERRFNGLRQVANKKVRKKLNVEPKRTEKSAIAETGPLYIFLVGHVFFVFNGLENY